jgi:hypothetical protein
MITSELVQRIKSAGFFPIHVEWNTDRNGDSELRFVGSLEEFFEATKALGITSVFFLVWKLDEEDFLYDSDYEEDGDYSDEVEPASEKSDEGNESFDLTVALPSLADFKKRIGQEHEFLLVAKSQFASISFSLSESWWDSFAEQREKAIQKVDENREAMREKMEKQKLEKENELLKQVRGLLNDLEFSRIPTQRGMKAYALEKFPKLEEVDESSLVEEIRKLDDKLKARKRK